MTQNLDDMDYFLIVYQKFILANRDFLAHIKNLIVVFLLNTPAIKREDNRHFIMISMQNDRIAVISAKRSAIGKYEGQFHSLSAVDLATLVNQNIFQETHIDPQLVDQVILGNVYQTGSGQNPARQTALRSGLSNSATAFTVNQLCASGMKAIKLASDTLRLDDSRVVLAGGSESMTNTVRFIKKDEQLTESNLQDSLFVDGLVDPFNNKAMGLETESLAEKYQITRESQDRWAYRSHQKAYQATLQGRFLNEIVPIQVQNQNIKEDQSIRPDSTLEKLAQLKSVFKTSGRITAGNAAPLNDGAAMLLLTKESFAEKQGWPIIAYLNTASEAGVQSEFFGYGPVEATQKLLKKQARTIADYDLFEINEAFAAQVLVDAEILHIPAEKINVNGGSLALGHPLGASGARIVVSLIHALRNSGLKRGLAMLCVGGGMGMAMEIEVD